MQTRTNAEGWQELVPQTEDRDYDALLTLVGGAPAVGQGPVFTTDAEGLYDLFLDGLPDWRRQHYRCNCCRTFVERFGGLVRVGPDGDKHSVLWLPPSQGRQSLFDGPVSRMLEGLERARITGVFMSGEEVWGKPENQSPKSPTGTWRHLSARPTMEMRRKGSPLKTDDQAMAERREEYGMLQRGLAEFSLDTVRQAHQLLQSESLYRSEKVLGVAKWLLDLHQAREGTSNARRRDNLTWLAVATAPVGFCHVRSTMIGTLLEDIAAGKPAAEVQRAFSLKMNPLQYQRPQAAPTDGQLAAAEKVVETLRSAGALNRRFARLEDVVEFAVWTPKPIVIDSPPGGVFDHLKSDAQEKRTLDSTGPTMTWEKFRRTVIPTAERMDIMVESHDNFFSFVTAEDMAAPPIIQWDREDARNPVNWYLYHGGAHAHQFGLSAGFREVTAITTQPSGWRGGNEHQGDGAYFIIRGACDKGQGGLALFPETLRSEYHGIRSAIEAYSRSRQLTGRETGSACGICLQKSGRAQKLKVRVFAGGVNTTYTIDRWD